MLFRLTFKPYNMMTSRRYISYALKLKPYDRPTRLSSGIDHSSSIGKVSERFDKGLR